MPELVNRDAESDSDSSDDEEEEYERKEKPIARKKTDKKPDFEDSAEATYF